MTQQLFIVFLQRLIKSSDRKIFLIVDNLSVHHGKKILKPWLEKHKDEIEIFYQLASMVSVTNLPCGPPAWTHMKYIYLELCNMGYIGWKIC